MKHFVLQTRKLKNDVEAVISQRASHGNEYEQCLHEVQTIVCDFVNSVEMTVLQVGLGGGSNLDIPTHSPNYTPSEASLMIPDGNEIAFANRGESDSQVASPLLDNASSGVGTSGSFFWQHTKGLGKQSPPPTPQGVRKGPRKSMLPGGSMYAASFKFKRDVTHIEELDKTVTEDGDKIINGHTVIQELGRGAYGKVKLVIHEGTGETRAMKIMNKSLLKRVSKPGGLTALQQAQREVAIMKKLHHKNVVQLYEVIDDPEADKMYLIMQYIANGPVLELAEDGTCTPLLPSKIRHYLRQLSAGLLYMHTHGVTHRDIKPDNVLISANDDVYLCDFGVSDLSMTVAGQDGTPAFFAPEMCMDECDFAEMEAAAVDMWALGVTLYCMLYGRLPFAGSRAAVMDMIRTQDPPFPTATEVEPDLAPPPEEHGAFNLLVAVIKGMLVKDPKARMTLLQMRDHKALRKTAAFASPPDQPNPNHTTARQRRTRVFTNDGEEEDIGGSTNSNDGPLRLNPTSASSNSSTNSMLTPQSTVDPFEGSMFVGEPSNVDCTLEDVETAITTVSREHHASADGDQPSPFVNRLRDATRAANSSPRSGRPSPR